MKKWRTDKYIAMRQYRKPGDNNRGSSLVEVIVAMLVLAIIIIPMLDMFQHASGTNRRARERQYENAALENVAEEIRAGNYTCIYNTWDAENCEPRELGTGKLCLYSDQSEGISLSGKTFTTSVFQQGEKEYQARVSFDADEYREVGSNLNDFKMPDIKSFDSTNSEMVMLDGSSDTIVIEEFYRQYLAQEEAEYQERLNNAWMNSEEYLFRYEFDRWREQWEAQHGTEPGENYAPPVFQESSVWRASVVSQETFVRSIKKQTNLNIVPTEAGEYTVEYQVFYSVDTELVDLGLDGEFEETYEYTYGSGTAFTAENLKNIFVFYQPFTIEMTQEKLVINVEEISLEEDWECRVYLAVQGGNGAPMKVELEAAETLSPWERYNKVRIHTTNNLMYGGILNLAPLVPTLAPKDRIYRVMIEVMEPETKEVLERSETTVYLE